MTRVAFDLPPPAVHRPLRYTTRRTSLFQQLAESVARQLSALLCSEVAIVDERGVVRASSSPALVDQLFDRTWLAQRADLVTSALRIGSQRGTVVVSPPENGEVVSPRLIGGLVELMVNELNSVERLPNRSELKEMVIYDMLTGAVADDEALLRHARILNLDLAPPRTVLLIDAADDIMPIAAEVGDVADGRDREEDARRRARAVIEHVVSFFHLPSETICADMGNGEVAVLKASNTKNLAHWADGRETGDGCGSSWANLRALLRASEELNASLQKALATSFNIGIGRYYPGISGLARSYQDARAALRLGRHFHGHGRVHCLDNLGAVAFVGLPDEQTKNELADYLLSPLDHEPELLKTLECFFANDCSPSTTATALAIHRNTLTYRIEKIAALTGLDPRRFDDAVQIRLALMLRCLQAR